MSYRPARRAAALQSVVMISSLAFCHTASAQISDWINPGADNWFNPTNWNLGVPGSGTIARINNGGFALLFDPGGSAAFLWMGSNAASLLTISGPGNLTLHGGELDVARGDLRIQNGGFLDVLNHPTLGSSAEIGALGPATVIVTGANSLLKSGSLYLGTSGTSIIGSGTLRIENGGWVDTFYSARLESEVSKTTTALITGAGSRWTIAEVLTVQGGGASAVTIADRGTINAGVTQIGRNSTLTVTGSGSSLNTSSSFQSIIVGYLGTGTLNVQSGGVVNSPIAVLGYSFSPETYGTGSATITGAGSLWNVSQKLFVGGDGVDYAGTGVLRVQNGGLVQAPMIRVSNIGSVEVDNGSTTVAGLAISGGAAAPNLNNLGDLSIGVNANGRMTITGGGDVWTATGQIGRNAGRMGSAVVQGAGSTWSNSSDLLVGASGSGSLEIRNGAAVSNFRAHVGLNANSSGSVIVADPGSSWTGTGSFFIGNGGSGSLQVLNGATASTSGNSYLGFSTFSQGTATVSGVGSTWNTANTLAIGGSLTDPGGPFASTLRIETGGLVTAASTILHNTGILELTEAAMLSSPISSRGGLIRTFGAATHDGPISLDAGNLSVTCNTISTTATLSGVLSGPGGLTKSGFPGFTGTLRLTANNTYAGPTTVNSGTLLIDGSIASATTVNSGGTLGGVGLVGPVTLMSGGSLAPGNSVGLLSSGDASFRAGSNYELEIRTSGNGLPGADWDSLTVNGVLDLSTLTAANRFNVRLKTLEGSGAPGSLSDWNPGIDHTWPSIVTTTGGISGVFDSALFNIDTTGFQNAMHGTFQVIQDGNNLNLLYDATDVVDGVLVTNFDQPLRNATPIGNNPNPTDPPEGPGAPWYWAAQQFQSDGLPHELISIQARVGDGSAAPPPVIVAELHADNNGTIGDLISNFTAPDVSGAPSDVAFLPDLPVALEPGGKYWFVLGSEAPGDGTFSWQYINTALAAGTGEIGNFADSTSSGNDWLYHGSLFPYYLQVNVQTTIPGDFNGDAAVDAADFVVLRNDPGVDPANLAEWRANFGQNAGNGSRATATLPIPEPSAVRLLASLLVAGSFRSRRWR